MARREWIPNCQSIIPAVDCSGFSAAVSTGYIIGPFLNRMRAQKLVPAIFLGLALVHAPAVHAALCKYVDDDGHVTYSDSPVKGAKKSSCFEAPPAQPAPPAANRATGAPPPATAQPAPPGGLPNVDPNTQKRRDDSRRKILEEELVVEEKALAQARKDLADGEATRLGDERNFQRFLDRIQGLKDRVSQHERNIAALKQELSNLR